MDSGTDSAATPGIATFGRGEWSVRDLVAAKRGRRVSVVLPALDEERTVGDVVDSILPLTRGDAGAPPLVDELLVVDSGSTDRTREAARAAGARALGVEEILAGDREGLAPRPGKGETLWRSLAATRGEIIAFVDSDLRNPSADFVPGIVGPLLLSERHVLVKGSYRRPLAVDGAAADPEGGGRVTELLAKPLLAAFVPELAGLHQPLAGEYAMRRDFAESVPFAAEYGVEMGLVLDAFRHHGVEGIAQVDLGAREHRHRSVRSLAGTSRQVAEVLARRLDLPVRSRVLPEDRPPMRDVLAALDATARDPAGDPVRAR